ncbi:MAG: peptidoglycan D,D-transpeptidase FtsI family protein [Candidatus Comchoanobacterales bacterium]
MKSHRLRYVLVIIGLCLSLSAIVYRLIDLTIIQREFLVKETKARSNRLQKINVPRGDILDRHGKPLAMSLYKQSVWVNPQETVWSDEETQQVAKILGLSSGVINKKINQKNQFVYLKRHLSSEQFKLLKSLDAHYGLHFVKEFGRYYPAGASASQLVGRVNIDGKGQEGIELAYDDSLKGKAGQEEYSVNRKGQIISERNIIKQAKQGKHIQLTLDRHAQFIAYQALRQTVQQFNAASAEAIVIAIPSGDVLAVANYPSYDPNKPLKSLDLIRNKALTDINEPGSIIKPISMVALLNYGFDEQTIIDTNPGHLRLNGHDIHDEFKPGQLSLSDIIRRSSNIGMSKLMLQVPQDDAANLYQKMGLNKTITLGFPGERSGHSNLHRKMTDFDRAAISFGYGIETSLMQIANGIAIIANDGKNVPIHIIKDQSTEQSEQVISSDVAHKVRDMMVKVTQKGGTGFRADVKNVAVAGKTGTTRMLHNGQYQEEDYRASFIGFAPADKPKYLIAVQVDKPRGSIYGGRVAAPAFKTIFSQLWAYHLS